MAYPISPESFVPVQPYGAYDGFPPYLPQPPATPIVPGNIHEALAAKPIQLQDVPSLPRTITPGSASPAQVIGLPEPTPTNIVPQSLNEALQAKPVQLSAEQGLPRNIIPGDASGAAPITQPQPQIQVAGKPTLHEALANNPVQLSQEQGLPKTVTPVSAAQAEPLSPIRTTTNIVPQNISEALKANPVQFQDGPGQVRPVTPYGQTQGLQIVRPGESISDGVYRKIPNSKSLVPTSGIQSVEPTVVPSKGTINIGPELSQQKMLPKPPEPGFGDVINAKTDTGKRWYTNIKAQEMQKGIDAAKNAPAAQQGIETAAKSVGAKQMLKNAAKIGGNGLITVAPAAINMLSDRELLGDESVPLEARLRVAGEDAVRGLASGIPFMLGGSPWTLPLKIGASAIIDNTLPDNMFGANNIRAGYQADKQQRGLDAAQQQYDARAAKEKELYDQAVASGDVQRFEDIGTPGVNGAVRIMNPAQPKGLNAVPPEAQQSEKRAQQIGEDGGITQGDPWLGKGAGDSERYITADGQYGIRAGNAANNTLGTVSSSNQEGMARIAKSLEKAGGDWNKLGNQLPTYNHNESAWGDNAIYANRQMEIMNDYKSGALDDANYNHQMALLDKAFSKGDYTPEKVQQRREAAILNRLYQTGNLDDAARYMIQQQQLAQQNQQYNRADQWKQREYEASQPERGLAQMKFDAINGLNDPQRMIALGLGQKTPQGNERYIAVQGGEVADENMPGVYRKAPSSVFDTVTGKYVNLSQSINAPPGFQQVGVDPKTGKPIFQDKNGRKVIPQ